LPERDLSKVKLGQSAKLVSAYDDTVWTTGVVSRIAPVVDPGTGTFRVTLSLAPEQHVLRPGQFVSVELEVERRENVAVVPRRAVVYEDGRAVVYRMVVAPPPEEDDEAEEEESSSSWFALFKRGEEDESEDEAEDEAAEKWIAERCPIERGAVDTESVQILSGVDVGDSIIVVGQSNLRDGARVRTPEMSIADSHDEEPPEAAEEQEAD
jgi:multidrug efflux pump subunit AcrA (membrane-fusion protein)